MTRTEILSTAATIITQDRNSTYGEPENSFGTIAAFWSAYLDRPVSASDVAVMMTLLKCARIKANPAHLDSFIDASAYAAIAGELASND